MTTNGIMTLMEQNRFSHIRAIQRGDIWGRDDIRMTTEFNNSKTCALECRIILPFREKILDLAIPNETASNPPRVTKSGDKLILIRNADNMEELEMVVTWAANIAALTGGTNRESLDKFHDGTTPLPCLHYTGEGINNECLELLSNRLKSTRALQISSDLGSLSVYLDKFNTQPIFEIKPVLLSCNEKNTLTDLLETASSLQGAITLINMEVLEKDDKILSACLAVFSRLNMLPEHSGGRIILYHPANGKMEQNALPSMRLPNIYRPVFQKELKANNMEATPSMLSYLSLRHNNHVPAQQAVEEAAEEIRLRPKQVDRVSTIELKRPYCPARNFSRSFAEEQRKIASNLLEENLTGHDEIKSGLIKTLMAYLLIGLNRPLVLAFCGPSGVGKNLLSLIIAHIFWNFFKTSEPQYIQFNTAAVISRWDLQKLTGVQAGLKGMEKVGLLEKFASTPGGVISFDELDKGGSDSPCQDFLYELLDTGVFINGHGDTIKLPRCVIVLTMNAGKEELYQKAGTATGFIAPTEKDAVSSHYRRFLNTSLLPALRGRIDKAFFFNHLTAKELFSIGIKELERIQHTLEGAGIAWPATNNEETVRRIVEKIDKRLGARGVVRAVETLAGDLFGEEKYYVAQKNTKRTKHQQEYF